ncbi:MAG: baseplate multidomain protein megatron [Pseudomonadota bacterium]
MASIVLASAGAAIGGGIGGAVLGVGAATIGGAVGSIVGSALDGWLVSQLAPTQRIEGPRLESLQVTTSTEGAVIPRVFGRMRVGGNVIWATDFREETRTTRQGGGKGGGGGAEVTEYAYFASFAVALCEGPITGVGRIWADGKPLDREGVAMRVHLGDEAQEPDPLIAAKMGADATPAYRGTAYVVFEELALGRFGNRLPQLSFEVFRPLMEARSVERMARAVTLIPSAGEFIHATETVRREEDGATVAENVHARADATDLVVALDQLEAALPNVEAVSLVVAWFGDDLRAGACSIRPCVETASKETEPQSWRVDGVSRADARRVSFDASGRPLYGGTPSDEAVVQAIRELKARGKRVTFYPFILMDVPAENDLPNPYSDEAAEVGQPAHPWRGRITCSPAAGYAGSVDKTEVAGDQVAAFFGAATPGDFAVSGEAVSWTGPAGDWGLRRMILHYAHLCAAAGGVDAFLVASELRGLTWIRDGAESYPAVQALRDLAADAGAILGPHVAISYAADWSEYFGHQPQDGSGDVFFHLDPLWADGNVDFIGIDAYLPLADWRDGEGHLDAQAGWRAITDRGYLAANIEGGEGYDWFYASDADRDAQIRTPIADGAHGKPWVFRPKDIRNWWANPHHDRPGGVERATPTAWTPQMKPIRFTELGCPAVDRGANQPNVFFDPKSSESALPHFSRGWRDDAIQRRYLEAVLSYWGEAANTPVSSVYGGRMLEMEDCALWTWDARPYPVFPAREDVWSDAANWRLGHWLNGRLGAVSLGALVREVCRRAGLADDQIDVSELAEPVQGYAIGALESPRASLAPLMRVYGFDAVESEGRIRFLPRGGSRAAVLSQDALVAPDDAAAEAFELTRAQETELDQALKWRLLRADEDFEALSVEAQRRVGAALRVNAESFPIAAIPSEAERRCRRALQEAWAARETAVLRLPPSRLALDPGDVVALENDGRLTELRLSAIADAEARAMEAARTDPAIYDLAPGPARASAPARPVVHGPPSVALMDLPQLSEETPAHHPLAAVRAAPWPGAAAVWRSPGADDFRLFAAATRPARMGRLTAELHAGPVSRFDLGNAAELELSGGTLESVSDLALFGGVNALAIEGAAGVWEVLQFGRAELLAPGRYRLSRLLRGQRGTEEAMGDPAPAGARAVILDEALTPLPVSQAELGLPFAWRVGPASRAPSDAVFVERSFAAKGAGLRPFSVGHVRQPWRHARSPGDLEIRWSRRSRALSADGWGAVDVAIAEEVEAYEVEILGGPGVLRTLSSAEPRAIYAGADQVADFGALLGPGDQLDLRIFQLSALVGRGAPKAVTLFF